jgi:hypothetical protein
MKKLWICSLILFIAIAGLVETGFRYLDNKTHFRDALLWQYQSASNSSPYLDSGYKFTGLAPNEIPVRVADSEEGVGYFRSGIFEKNAYHPKANQQILLLDSLISEKKVFVLGESAGFGFPLTNEETFSSLLEKKLAPKGIGVVNASQPGIISNLEIDLADRILDFYKPAAMIYYLGNNIWISWRPPLSSLQIRTFKTLEFLAHSRTLAWIESKFYMALGMILMPPSKVDPRDPIEFGVKNPLISPAFDWSLVKARHLDYFKNRLVAQIQKAKQKQVPVILLSIPFNYRVPPHRTGPQIIAAHQDDIASTQKDLIKGENLIRENHFDDALDIAEKLIAKSPTTPFPYYLKGLALEKQGRFIDAENAYTLSRDFTIGNLGSIPTLNKMIKEIASNMKVDFIDIKKIFDEDSHSRGVYFNEDLIGDDCHPTARGHQLISDALTKAIR